MGGFSIIESSRIRGKIEFPRPNLIFLNIFNDIGHQTAQNMASHGGEEVLRKPEEGRTIKVRIKTGNQTGQDILLL